MASKSMIFLRSILKETSYFFKKDRNFIFICFILALLIRIIYVIQLSEPPYWDNYHDIANNLLNHREFSIQPGYPTSERVPVYPLFLAFIYLFFGPNYIAVRIIQAIIGSLTSILVFLIGRNIFNRRVGGLSAILAAFYPFFIYWTGHIMAETLFIFLLAFFIFCLTKAMEKPSLKNYIYSGVLFGLAALCRPNMFAFLPFLIIGILMVSHSKIKSLIAILFAFFLTLSPWVIRNYLVHRTFIPLTTRGGRSFLCVYNKDNFYRGDLNLRYRKVLAEGDMMKPVEQERFFYRQTVDFIKKHPKEYLRICGLSFLQFWRLYPNPNCYSQKYIITSLLTYGLLLPFSLFGIVLSFKRWRKAFFLYAVILAFTIIHLFFESQVRYRSPIMPYMIIFASVGILDVYGKTIKKIYITHKNCKSIIS